VTISRRQRRYDLHIATSSCTRVREPSGLRKATGSPLSRGRRSAISRGTAPCQFSTMTACHFRAETTVASRCDITTALLRPSFPRTLESIFQRNDL